MILVEIFTKLDWKNSHRFKFMHHDFEAAKNWDNHNTTFWGIRK